MSCIDQRYRRKLLHFQTQKASLQRIRITIIMIRKHIRGNAKIVLQCRPITGPAGLEGNETTDTFANKASIVKMKPDSKLELPSKLKVIENQLENEEQNGICECMKGKLYEDLHCRNIKLLVTKPRKVSGPIPANFKTRLSCHIY